jgi:acid phosphatase
VAATTRWSTRARAALVGAVVLLGGALAGCGSGTPSAGPSSTGPSTPEPSATASVVPASPTPSATSPATSSATPPAGPVPIDKVLVLVVENHSLDAMRSQMPWTYALARRYGYATGYRAVTHPSLPNYLAISGGDTFGVADDHDPSAHPLGAPSVFGQALGSGHTAKVYAEDMPGACVTTSSGRYAVRHNPWTYHVTERAACRRDDVPLTALAADVRAGRLPNAGMVVPNLCHDAHDCPAATADAWLRTVVGSVLAGPDFTSGRLLVVITADEDDHTQGNLVLTTLVNPQLQHRVVASALDHYSLSRLYSEVLGGAPLRRAASAASLVSAFGLRVAPAG